MKVLITGARGFVGKNAGLELQNRGHEVIGYDIDSTESELVNALQKVDFIVHLAGINRPLTKEEFYSGNANFTYKLIELLKQSGRVVPLFFSSSIQAALDNDYGKSKKLAEDYLFDFGKTNNNPVYVYRLANLFGKWSRPNYNSVIATFAHNIAHGLDITINNRETEIEFLYIDDVVKEIVSLVENTKQVDSHKLLFCQPTYQVSLGELADLLISFREMRTNLMLPQLDRGFVSKLYATYLSYLPPDQFSYRLNMHQDHRGSFTEFIRTEKAGQVSVNVALPGITKGQHYHHTKNEKFLVVKGKAVIKFRKIDEDTIYEYAVDGDQLTVVDIPPGYTHSITNVGESELVTVVWASEGYDPNYPDTYFLPVEK